MTSQPRVLAVRFNGEHVADITEVGIGLGASLRYTRHALDTYGPGAVLLSVRLPVREEFYPAIETSYFLEGLLPEDQVRAALASRARVPTQDTFGLLARYGLDCAGAVQVIDSAAGEESRSPAVRWLDETELAEAIRGLPAAPLGTGIDDGVRSSLGGMQGKLPVVYVEGRIGVPLYGMPSTHILKPAQLLEDGSQAWPGVVAMEAFGLRVISDAGAQGLELRAAECRPFDVTGRPALLVTRFDRVVGGSPGQTVRRHQEDAAQALGTLQKYEQAGNGSPSLRAIALLLQEHAMTPILAQQALAELVVLNAVLGNCDFHARNISFLLDKGAVSLSPAYDVVTTAAWPKHTRDLSLRVGGALDIDELRREHLTAEFVSWGYRPAAAQRVLDNALAAARIAMPAAEARARAEGWWEPVLEDVAAQAAARLNRLTDLR